MFNPSSAATSALPLFAAAAVPDKAIGLLHAATTIAGWLAQNRNIDTPVLRAAMEAAFNGSDADGAWVWKDAYEACEAGQVLFLRKFGAAMRARAGSPRTMLAMLSRLSARLPSHTRRSPESQQLQQFSTPLALGLVVAEAAGITRSDLVLEPSAGTGMLAIFAELAGARLALNEIADTRAGLLARLFREVPISRHNAEQIHDRLDAGIRPNVIVMNPPFSASPEITGRFAETTLRHLNAAVARLAEGGRLVAITGHNVGPEHAAWRDAFLRLQETSRIVFTAAIAGQAYARHGTSFDTRLTVIDRIPAADPNIFPSSPAVAKDAAELLDWVTRSVPVRRQISAAPIATATATVISIETQKRAV